MLDINPRVFPTCVYDTDPGDYSEMQDFLLFVAFGSDGDVAAYMITDPEWEEGVWRSSGIYSDLLTLWVDQEGNLIDEANESAIALAIDMLGECRDIDYKNETRAEAAS